MEFGEIQNRLAVCADCRFSNELNAVKNRDFITIRIIRPDNDYIVDDVSEKDLDDVPDNFFNFIVVNDGTLEELKTFILLTPSEEEGVKRSGGRLA